jgi:hypothetical protein
VNVIRHDYVTPHSDVEVALGTLGENNKCPLDIVARQKLPSVVRAKGDENKEGSRQKRAPKRGGRSPKLCTVVATALWAVQCILNPTSHSLDRPQAGGYRNR